MNTNMLVQQSRTCERACAVATSERPFIDMCFHVSAVLDWMREGLAALVTSQVFTAPNTIALMNLKLLAVCKRLKTLITSPCEIIRWIEAHWCSCLLFVSIASSSIRGRPSFFS